MDKRKLMLPLALFAIFALGISTSAMADNVTLNLTNGFLVPCPVGGCATVTVLANSTTHTATITVTSLLAGYQFDTFGFNFTGSGSFSLTGSSGAVDPGSAHYGLGGLGNEDGFGKFEFNFDTGLNGGSTGFKCSGSAADPDCSFTIALAGTSITSFSQFETLLNGTNKNSLTWFAGHIANSTCTGFVGGGGTATSRPSDSSSCTSVPEPASLTVLGVGLLAAGFVLRRKLRK